jgi:multiple sugar transport system ATP-binding protein
VGVLRGDRVQLGFRPEALRLAHQDDAGSFPVEALVIEELGSDAFLYGNLIGDDLHSDHVVARIAPRSVPTKGAKVWFSIEPGRLHAFDVETGEALPTD